MLEPFRKLHLSVVRLFAPPKSEVAKSKTGIFRPAGGKSPLFDTLTKLARLFEVPTMTTLKINRLEAPKKKFFISRGSKKKMGKGKPQSDLYLTFFLALASLRLDKALEVFIPDKTSRPSAMIGVVRTAQSIPVLTCVASVSLPRSPRNPARLAGGSVYLDKIFQSSG
jgi:hypothetical protein